MPTSNVPIESGCSGAFASADANLRPLTSEAISKKASYCHASDRHAGGFGPITMREDLRIHWSPTRSAAPRT